MALLKKAGFVLSDKFFLKKATLSLRQGFSHLKKRIKIDDLEKSIIK
jgi:hypothetical protein